MLFIQQCIRTHVKCADNGLHILAMSIRLSASENNMAENNKFCGLRRGFISLCIASTLLLATTYYHTDVRQTKFGHNVPNLVRLVSRSQETLFNAARKSQEISDFPANDVSRQSVRPRQHASETSRSPTKEGLRVVEDSRHPVMPKSLAQGFNSKQSMSDLHVNDASSKKLLSDLHVKDASSKKSMSDLHVMDASSKKSMSDLHVNGAISKQPMSDLDTGEGPRSKVQFQELDDIDDLNQISANDVCSDLLPEERTLSERRDCFRRKCDARKNTTIPNDKLAKFIQDEKNRVRLIISEKHKVLYCKLAKVSSTNMFRLFHFLEFGGNETSLASIRSGKARNSPIPELGSFSRKKINHILATYTKVVVTRDPLERLLSAYRDERGSQGKNFTEFLYKVEKEVTHKRNANLHVDTFTRRCLPCSIAYDYLSTTATLEEDMNSLLMQLGLSQIHFPSRNETRYSQTSSAEALAEYYATLPADLTDSVWRAYYSDYYLFGYPHPKDLRKHWQTGN